MSKQWKDMCKKIFTTKDTNFEREQEDFHRTYRLLLLGTKESGKTTIMKQMKILYGAGFNEVEKKAFVKDIRNYVKEIVQKTLHSAAAHRNGIRLERTENDRYVEYVLSLDAVEAVEAHGPDDGHVPLQLNGNDSHTDLDLVTPEFWEAAQALWTDRGFQELCGHSPQFQLLDNAKYFLDRIPLIRCPDYLPDEQDILRVRVHSTNSMETVFAIDHIRYHVFNVAGQRDQKGKWLQCFNNITAILFVLPMSGYDVVVPDEQDETQMTNRLAESLHVFAMLWNSKWLTRKTVILFLNKLDQFQEKIIRSCSSLEAFFPSYKDYCVPSSAMTLPGDNLESLRARYYIRHEITRITSSSNTQHVCYPHFTAAIDGEAVRRVFNDCRDIIQRSQLQHTQTTL
ncbi:guanine nucleotide-binding protein G(s) subunit alpha-like [Paramacrobiotus metropolitanus]|uniref:guanine nucleotide-binding protein G(s) subunit alpha-like n=1 Tax=Paramacrobiotus metropolitanus TaxID=2943436 RepID=UPI00244653C4|nr:guanine nucleotide-binding protein G(s) subunit alpha-like [Paramacrobiotus metropolitanus]